MKKAAGHVCAVIKGIFFIGFSIQIVLGIIWMCCNFAQVQEFGEPDSALYMSIFRLFGENPQILYLLQLALAFFAGYRFLQTLHPVGGWFAIWRGLAVLTFPFAMQCHLAILPHSLMGSLFLLMLSYMVKCFSSELSDKVRKRKKVAAYLGLTVVFTLLFVVLSGATDADNRERVSERSFEAALASRMAWPTIWNDFEFWTEDLQVLTEEVLWEATFSPENMERVLLSEIENRVGDQEAKAYYLQMAEVGWRYRAPMIIRQMGWDILGYTVTPLVFQLQLKGDAYDSYTGRNYEIMRDNAPVFTKYYVNYGSWWFGCCLVLGICFAIALKIAKEKEIQRASVKRMFLAAVICVLASGILVVLLTMRGAGLMDYKYTIAVNELWLIWALLLMGKRWKTW